MNILTRKEPQTASETSPRRTITPRYDVHERTDAFVLTAHVPGVDRAALETTIDGETLTIVGRRGWAAPTDWTLVYREITPFDYRLVLELDPRVNREAVKAELSQGVLTLTLPKAEAVKPRKIEIS